MAVTVVTPADSRDLTTVHEVKEGLGLDQDDETHDQFIGRLIGQASGAIERWTGRPFARETVKETLAGVGRVDLVLSRTPIISVASVTIDGDVVTDFSIRDAEAGILFRESGWPTSEIRGHNIASYLTGETKDTIEVQYEGGYDLPGSEGSFDPTLPADVERACIETVKAWFMARDRDPALASEKVGDFWAASYKPGELPDSAKALLRPWRRLA